MTEADFRAQLTQALTDVVNGQMTRPDQAWYLTLYVEDVDDFFVLYSRAMMEAHYTNRPELGIGFVVNAEQEQRLKSLPIASELKRDDKDMCHPYCADCGNDVEKAADIICTMLNEVYQFNVYPAIDTFSDDVDPFLKSFNDHTNGTPVTMAFDLPEGGDYTKLAQKVDAYNKEAAAKGYVPIKFDGKTLEGKLEYKNQASGGFFAKMKSTFNDGYMAEDFHAILTLCLAAINKPA